MADLSPERRKQLDDIVVKLDSEGASTPEIQAVVDDFKKKYTPQTLPQKVGSAIWEAAKNASAGKDVYGQPLYPPDPQTGKPTVRPLDLGPIAYGAPAPERVATALELLKNSGITKNLAKAGLKGIGAGMLTTLKSPFRHPWTGTAMALSGLGDLGDAAKTLWQAFKAAGGGTQEEFETWLANQDREAIWKKAGATGQPAPASAPPAQIAPAPAQLPSGRSPGPAPPKPAPVAKPPMWQGITDAPSPSGLPPKPVVGSASPVLPSGRIPGRPVPSAGPAGARPPLWQGITDQPGTVLPEVPNLEPAPDIPTTPANPPIMSSWKPTGKIPGSYAARGEPLTMSEPKWNNLTPEEQAEWRDAVATQDKPKAAPAQAAAAAAAPTPTPENIAPATSTPAPSDAGDLSDPLRRSIAQANARKAAAEQQPKIPPEYLQNKINVADAGAKVLRDLGVTREHMQRLKTSNPQAYEDVFTNVAKLPGVSKQANYPLTDEVTRGMMIDRLPSESTLPDYPHFQQ